MMPERHAQQVRQLQDAADALDRGDWRSAWPTLFHDGPVADRPDLPDVAVCLRCVARGLRFQSVRADVESASHQVDTALRTLGRYRARLVATPSRDLAVEHLLRSTNRLVQRERADLDALRRIAGDLRRGHMEWIYATVEYLTFVEFDPFTVRIHESDRALTGLDRVAYNRWRSGNRLDLCARATGLRQFADARSGSVSERTWQRTGGYPVLREEALRVLAGEPETRGRADLPVRLGRVRAWNYARDWLDDTAA